MLFTDMQDSTKLWQLYPEQMPRVLELHDACIRNLIDTHGGYEVKTEGDAFMITFSSAKSGVDFACALQQELLAVDWPQELLAFHSCAERRVKSTDAVLWRGPRIRVGLHTGMALRKDFQVVGLYGNQAWRHDFFGHDVNLAARVSALAQGGQTLLSQACKVSYDREVSASSQRLPGKFVHCGAQELKGIGPPVDLWELQSTKLSQRTFTPFRSALASRQQQAILDA